MSTNPQQSQIANLINASRVTKTQKKNDDKIRFVIEMTPETREKLSQLCETLNCGQIKFASQLFAIALDDAMSQL